MKDAVLEVLRLAGDVLSGDEPVFERDEKGYALVSFRVRGEALFSFLKLLKQCDYMGSIGHSFSIVLDPNSKENRRSVGFDGDGSDRVKDIKVNGELIPSEFEW